MLCIPFLTSLGEGASPFVSLFFCHARPFSVIPAKAGIHSYKPSAGNTHTTPATDTATTLLSITNRERPIQLQMNDIRRGKRGKLHAGKMGDTLLVLNHKKATFVQCVGLTPMTLNRSTPFFSNPGLTQEEGNTAIVPIKDSVVSAS